MVSDVTSVAKLEELVRSINFMGNQFDDFSKKIDFVLKEIKDLKSGNQKIITENKYLKEEIITMKQKMYDLVQFNIGNCVEIKGIPKTTNENCTDIVQAISKKINLDVSIKSTFRIHSTSTNTSIFVVNFNIVEYEKKFYT